MDFFKKVFKSVEDGTSRLKRDPEVQKWLTELEDAFKREKSWRKEARRVVDLYEQERAADDAGTASDFNILYANTETLSPAVYNNTPRPIVKRKVDKENPLAIAAAQVLKNVLTYLADTGDSSYTPFDELQKLAVLEALVPGRGLCRFSYDAYVEAQQVKTETVCGDPVPWDRVRYGYAKAWADVPWMAYEHFMTREECRKTFGDELGNKIKLTHSEQTEGSEDGENSMPADAQGVKFAHIWEIWDKASRKQLFLSEGYPTLIEANDDPLGLEGFFNAPRPIQFAIRIKSLVPQTLYLLYETQAKELDDVTRRIGALTRAMKIRGFYDGTLEGLDELLRKPENTLLPAQNVAAMQQGMTLEKAIWLMPLEKLITVLQQLYINRGQIINTIHQITGIADIMRGASAASETLGAQKMKEAWGTMRLKRMQKEAQRFARDCLRLQAELAAKKFSIETLQMMTGLKFPRMQDKELAQQEQMAVQQQAEQLQAQAQMGGQAIPPQAGQQLQAKLAQIQQILAQPSWEDIVNFLRSDSIRNYVIDIETNTTLDIEATEDKAELAEMMNSMGQLLNGVLPMVQNGTLPFQAAKSLMLAVVQKFRMSEEVEETFRAMQEPKQKPDPAQMKVEAEMKRDQQKFQMEQQAQQAELATQQQKQQLEKQELELQATKIRQDMEYQTAMHQMRMAELAAKASMPRPAPAQQSQPQPQGT